MSKKAQLVVEGRTLVVSNLDKVLYPKDGFTKGELINYYIRIAPVLLPHLKNRPLTMKRYPDGVEGEFFYEKNCPSHRPKWVRTARVWSESNQRNIDFCLAQDLPRGQCARSTTQCGQDRHPLARRAYTPHSQVHRKLLDVQ